MAPKSTLQSRNVVIDNNRTSMRLEPEMWDGLREIAKRENTTVNNLCTQVNLHRRQSSLTSAIRVFIVAYYRDLARVNADTDMTRKSASAIRMVGR